jgi:BMFP domain-containing protein YqiC
MAIIEDLDKLTTKLSELITSEDSALKQDIKKNIRALLDSAFKDMDLVSREEYEVQVALLERTRERLNGLADRIKELEERR